MAKNTNKNDKGTEKMDESNLEESTAKDASASESSDTSPAPPVEPPPPAAAAKPHGPKVKVKSKVNMMCKDGTELVVGKHAELARHEHERLAKDKRGPFYDLV